MLETVILENIISNTILGYVLKLNDEISINKYIMDLKVKVREFKRINVKDFEKLCNSHKQKAFKNIGQKSKQHYSTYPDWIEVNKKSMPYQTINNCWNILKNDSEYKGKVTYNTFTNQIYLDRKL